MKSIAFIIIITSLSSCKQEYECCWYSNGEITEDIGFCIKDNISKKDADAAYMQVNNLEWKCEKAK